MTTRDDVLAAMQDLVLSTGRRPSVAAVAREVGLSKQGVLHHFPDRQSLDLALLRHAVARVDQVMGDAAAAGRAGATYLRLSTPSAEDRAVATVLLAALEQDAMPTEVWDEVVAAMNRWESLIAVEMGDARRAEVVRLVGDGLFSEAMLTGSAPSPERVDALVDFLLGDDGAEQST